MIGIVGRNVSKNAEQARPGKVMQTRSCFVDVVDAEKIMNILNKTCLRFGLTISFSKTKTQVFNNKELALENSWMEFLRHLVKGGWERQRTPEGADEVVYRLRYANADILAITEAKSLINFVRGQHMSLPKYNTGEEDNLLKVQEAILSRSLDEYLKDVACFYRASKEKDTR